MKGKVTKPRVVTSIDQRLRPENYTASDISNFRVDENLGYINDRGWEPLIPYETQPEIPVLTYWRRSAPHRFLAVYDRHQEAEQYYMYEQGGQLLYDFGNKGVQILAEETVMLDQYRHEPKANEPGTQLAPFGKFALILNGYDTPLLFKGRGQYRTFGWTEKPASPTAMEVQPDHITTTNLLNGQSVCIPFDKDGYIGLGQGDNGSINRFGYKVSFISDTGSESPKSTPVFVNWSIDNVAYEAKFGVFLNDMPIGPEGTVARKLYRTLNLKKGLSNSEVYYELATLNDNTTQHYVDIHPDSYLTTEASNLDSSPIRNDYKYASEYNGHMWLATETKIIYSKQGLPEQFPTFNYFDVGTRDGGFITGLQKIGGSLIVFRARSIDIINSIRTAEGTNYTCETLSTDIGTTATNTIIQVPGFGIVFLTADGFYSITGSQQGGGTYKVEKISKGLELEMKRLSVSALPRASASYSHREKEYWCHYPVDGDTENSRGAVLSTISNGWLLRNDIPFTQIATDPQGWFVMGTNSGPYVAPADFTAWPGLGLQVWSGTHTWGADFVYNSTVGLFLIYDATPRVKPASVFTSPWEDLGELGSKKRVLSVEIEIMTQGSNPIELLYAVDGFWNYLSAGTKTTQVPEYDNSTSMETVYNTAIRTGSAVWGQTPWEDAKRTTLIYDVPSHLFGTFKFKLESSNVMHVLSYKLYHKKETQQRTMRR